MSSSRVAVDSLSVSFSVRPREGVGARWSLYMAIFARGEFTTSVLKSYCSRGFSILGLNIRSIATPLDSISIGSPSPRAPVLMFLGHQK